MAGFSASFMVAMRSTPCSKAWRSVAVLASVARPRPRQSGVSAREAVVRDRLVAEDDRDRHRPPVDDRRERAVEVEEGALELVPLVVLERAELDRFARLVAQRVQLEERARVDRAQRGKLDPLRRVDRGRRRVDRGDDPLACALPAAALEERGSLRFGPRPCTLDAEHPQVIRCPPEQFGAEAAASALRRDAHPQRAGSFRLRLPKPAGQRVAAVGNPDAASRDRRLANAVEQDGLLRDGPERLQSAQQLDDPRCVLVPERSDHGRQTSPGSGRASRPSSTSRATSARHENQPAASRSGATTAARTPATTSSSSPPAEGIGRTWSQRASSLV
jgi:hypothetical protein